MNPFRLRLRVFVALLAVIFILGVAGSMATEDLSLSDAIYFTVVTIGTVGYGDITPVTPAGRLVAIMIIVLGVGTFLAVVANALEMMLSRHERQVRLDKLNMLIGIFYSEIGRQLLDTFVHSDPQAERLRADLALVKHWSEQDVRFMRKRLAHYGYTVQIDKIRLVELRTSLLQQRGFLVSLFANPALQEHQAFTELLRSVFHLVEELAYRETIDTLPEADRNHLAGDIARAYRHLMEQWLSYMRYLKENYPYLFSLAVRMNPFDPHATPIVRE